MIRYEAISDIGCVRANNEDMAYVAGELVRDDYVADTVDADAPVGFAVADGMGGYEGGEIASEIVCRSFASFIKSLPNEDENSVINRIKEWAKEANNLVYESAALRPELSEMGTTFVALIWVAKRFYMLNVGDSRCYRVRSGILKQLSTDHSERKRTGNPDIPSNLIYNFMGLTSRDFFSDVTELTPLKDDIYVLCSDGLSDLVDDDSIESNTDNIDKLVSLVKENGGKDNITLVKIEI